MCRTRKALWGAQEGHKDGKQVVSMVTFIVTALLCAGVETLVLLSLLNKNSVQDKIVLCGLNALPRFRCLSIRSPLVALFGEYGTCGLGEDFEVLMPSTIPVLPLFFLLAVGDVSPQFLLQLPTVCCLCCMLWTLILWQYNLKETFSSSASCLGYGVSSQQ